MKTCSANLKRSNKHFIRKMKEFSVMKAKNTNIDVDTIDFFIRKAHTERSNAITSAFGGLVEMVKNIFTAPESGNVARSH
jgi:hypothetical protein